MSEIDNNIWRIKMTAYDSGLLDSFVKNLTNICKGLMIKVKVIFLPVQNKRFSMCKSSFVYGLSKEHLEINFHKRAVFLELGMNRNLTVLNSVSVPSGIVMSVEKVTNKSTNPIKKPQTMNKTSDYSSKGSNSPQDNKRGNK